MIAIGTALSGLQASMMRLNASASNVANIESTGPVPPVSPAQPIPPRQQPNQASVYQAIRAQQSDVKGGGTIATYKPVSPSYRLRPDPTSPHANAQGLVGAPNVDLAGELTEQLSAQLAFKANLKVIETANRLHDSMFERWA